MYSMYSYNAYMYSMIHSRVHALQQYMGEQHYSSQQYGPYDTIWTLQYGPYNGTSSMYSVYSSNAYMYSVYSCLGYKQYAIQL